MSIEAMSFVLNLRMGKGNQTRKLILLGLANHADRYGQRVFPSAETVAEYADCDERSVRRNVTWLIQNGYIREGDQQLVAHYRRDRRPIVYEVAMSEQRIKEWAEDSSEESHRRQHQANGAKASRGDIMSARETDITGGQQEPHGGTSTTARGDTSVPQTVSRTLGGSKPSVAPQASEPPKVQSAAPTSHDADDGALIGWNEAGVTNEDLQRVAERDDRTQRQRAAGRLKTLYLGLVPLASKEAVQGIMLKAVERYDTRKIESSLRALVDAGRPLTMTTLCNQIEGRSSNGRRDPAASMMAWINTLEE